MQRRVHLLSVLWFAAATLISAFLVFQIQPVISKTVLPWFGGSPAVWTTSMLFFQVLLFAGYAYAHCTTRWLAPRGQAAVHFVLLLMALCLLPVTPGDGWKPVDSSNPTGHLLLILAANIGLPYFLLSATGPLLQAWFARSVPGYSPYRLYALSNAGSLAALLSYPVLFEPSFSTTAQGALWSLAFCGFALICGYLAVRQFRLQAASPSAPTGDAPTAAAPRRRDYATWLILPALASIALLATTNHVSQDVAVIPFLWIAPLSLYLLTFIICFDREQWYSRRWCGLLCSASGVGLCVVVEAGWDRWLLAELVCHLLAMFWFCMLCHGELVRARPAPRYLTSFYLLTSAGGAAGGLCVALLCPYVLSQYWEMALVVIVATAMGTLLFLGDARRTWLGGHWKRTLIAGLATVGVLGFVIPVQLRVYAAPSLATARNFYGVLHVKPEEDQRGKVMVHGRTVHGFQFRHPAMQQIPTTYYSPDSGVGLALRELRPQRPMRVGAVGLGCGTIAAYGQPGDCFRFYEINPAVEALARQHFSFLSDSPAHTEVVLGDARLSLEQEDSQDYDFLVLDAFSSDSIPTHLLTREAFAVYLRHMAADGVIAVHISNRNLRLTPVVVRLATQYNLDCLQIVSRANWMQGSLQSKWMLLTRNQQIVTDQKLRTVAQHFPAGTPVDLPLWTDRYNNLFQIMRIY